MLAAADHGRRDAAAARADHENVRSAHFLRRRTRKRLVFHTWFSTAHVRPEFSYIGAVATALMMPIEESEEPL